jgi:hypothetical protein
VDSAFKVDNAMFFDIISRYVEVLSESERYFEDNSSEFINAILSVTEENKKDFNYKGETLDNLIATLNFDAWDIPESTAKSEDTKKIVNIIMSFVGFMGDILDTQAGSEAQTVEGDAATPDEEGAGSVADGLGNAASFLELLKKLGSTLDLMSETECLGQLPAEMLKVILTNPMLGKIMTTSMLYNQDDGYLAQVDKIKSEYEKPIEDREIMVDENGNYVLDENGNYVYRYTYESFMESFVNRIGALLEKLDTNNDGGNDNA